MNTSISTNPPMPPMLITLRKWGYFSGSYGRWLLDGLMGSALDPWKALDAASIHGRRYRLAGATGLANRSGTAAPAHPAAPWTQRDGPWWPPMLTPMNPQRNLVRPAYDTQILIRRIARSSAG